MPNFLRIKKEFDSYRAQVIPKRASSTQVEECRRAFYAGGLAVFTLLLKLEDIKEECADADLGVVEQIHAELIEFGRGVEGELAAFPKCQCGGIAVSNASGDATRTCIRCGSIVRPAELCGDCPPAAYPTNETRCAECPRRIL